MRTHMMRLRTSSERLPLSCLVMRGGGAEDLICLFSSSYWAGSERVAGGCGLQDLEFDP
jgi:hypothetical protein